MKVTILQPNHLLNIQHSASEYCSVKSADLHQSKIICLCFFFQTQGELTYGKIGEWRFDKRSYLQSPPPRNLSLPPPGVPESVVCA